MAAGAIDRRIERTRETLRRAFVELLFERGYDDTSVADVVERANIGRSTFYEHYEGKGELLRECLAAPLAPLVAIVDGAADAASVTGFVDHMRENYRLTRGLFAGPTRPAVIRALADLIEPYLASKSKPDLKPVIPVGLIALQLAEAQMGLVDHWLAGGLPCKAEALAEALVATTQAIVGAVLRR